MDHDHGDGGSIRERQRDRWEAASTGWESLQTHIAANTRPVTDQMLEMLDPRPGERVIDLASGLGNPALYFAERVAPNGSVVGLDLTPAMVESATLEAQRREIANVDFRVIDAETDLPVPDGTFDIATCRFGLMFVPDPAESLLALNRALQSDGRIAVSTWGSPERNPLPRFWSDVVSRHVLPPDTPAPAPSWSAVDSIDGLEGVLIEAGFADIETVTVEVTAGNADSLQEFWERQTQISAALIETLAPLSNEIRGAIRSDTLRTLESMFPDGAVHFPGEALVSLAYKSASE